jgi:hypothetical protein
MGDGIHCEKCGNDVENKKQRFCPSCRKAIKAQLEAEGAIDAPLRNKRSRWGKIPIGKGKFRDGFKMMNGAAPDSGSEDKD